MMSIRDIHATKITGLKTIERRFQRLKSFPILHHHPPSHHLKKSLNITARTKNGAPMINTHRSHTLMIFATKRNSSPMVKKSIKKSLSAKESVSASQESLLVSR